MKYAETAPVLSKKNIAAGIWDMELYCPKAAAEAVPGQFVDIKAEGFTLRRPISICGIDKDKGTLRIVFEERGKGTAQIARVNVGECLDIIAPLGHGFELLDKSSKAVMIGGGIGTPPMLPLAQHYGENASVIFGFRNSRAVILKDDVIKAGAELILCTDDGSEGRKGFVTDALADLLSQSKPDIIYACGPMIMLKRIAQAAKDNGIRCQISLEERMACGVGACLGCACVTKQDGEKVYRHVCKNGPVFEAEEVAFDE